MIRSNRPAALADRLASRGAESWSGRINALVTGLVFAFGWLWGTAFFAVAPALAETIESLPAPGSRYQTVIELAHKRIPLPPGVWQVAGSGDEGLARNRSDTAPGAYDALLPGAFGVIESVVLVKLDGSAVDSFVVIYTNALAVDRGWGTNSECRATALPRIRVYEDGGTNLFCAFGGPVTLRRDTAAPKFWRQALDLARRKNWSLSEHWLMGGFRISDRHDVLEVRYHYQADGTPLATLAPGTPPGVIDASWFNPDNAVAGQDPHPPWLPVLSNWLDAMKSPIDQGFKGRLPNTQDLPSLPSRPPSSNKSGQIAGIDETPDSLTALFQKSVLKMLSWKVLGISAGLTIKYLFIGDMTTAVSLQVATSVVTGVLYVGYDMLWALAFPDKEKPVINFSSVTVPS